MSPRLILLLAVAAGVSAAGASIVTWIVVRPDPAPVSGPGAAATRSPSDEEQRRHRERFFGGNSDRDIRGGQEMKPQW